MKFFFTFLMYFAVVCSAMLPHTVWAEEPAGEGESGFAIGISPGLIDQDLYKGIPEEKTVNISRSITTGDTTFTITISGDDIIDLHGITSVTIPDGEIDATLSYDIITQDKEPGDYEAVIRFVMDQQIGPVAESGNAILYGLGQKIKIHLLPEADASTVFSVKDFPSVLSDILVRDFSAKVVSRDGLRKIVMSWSLANVGEYGIRDVAPYLTIENHEQILWRLIPESSDVIASGDELKQTAEYTIDSSMKSSTYNIVISLGGETRETASVWALQKKIKTQFTIIFIGTLLFIGVSGVLLTLKKPKRSG